MNNKPIIILSIFILLVVGVAVAYFIFPEFGSKISRVVDLTPDKPKVIENENLVIPDTQKITGSDGRVVEKGNVETPLVPKNEGEKIIVARAVLTVKGSYDKALGEAKNWADDAKLVFVKSLGAVTLEGKSSQWQIVFAAKSKSKKAYEIIIQADQIVSKKEIDSTSSGVDVPDSINDSGVAIAELQSLPQFSSVTISSIQLYYNLDAKAWFYSFATSVGTTSGPAQ